MTLALALAVSLSLAPAGSSEVIKLSPGQQEVLKYSGLRRVAIVREDYASVRVTKEGELLITGVQPGKTSMTLWLQDKIVYKTIVVDSGRGGELARLVREQVSPTLKVEEYGSKVIIDGTLDAVEELERLRILVGDDPNVKIMVHMNPRVLPVVAAQITQALDKAGLRTAHAVAIGNKIFLEGSVADAAESHKAEQIANAIYGQSVVALAR
ncbi:MAG: pilus assembly protein N-terminal domain-containing protein [Myxococcaceae bacterium]|nr:pilus assembly protein N-terminal domain-containing protein [Myxococcaceae bacterium]